MSNNNEIMKIRQQIEKDQLKLKQLEEQQGFNPMGEWEFSTEGDVEGRTTKQLGIYMGNIFDGIKKYSGMEYYKLSITKIGEFTEPPKTNNIYEVDIIIYDKFIEIHNKLDTEEKLKNHLPSGFTIAKSNLFGSVKIKWKN